MWKSNPTKEEQEQFITLWKSLEKQKRLNIMNKNLENLDKRLDLENKAVNLQTGSIYIENFDKQSETLIIPETFCAKHNREMEEQEQKAVKHDNGKIRMELLPPNALEEIAKVFTFGANKYEEWNYIKGEGLSYSRVYGAALRHLNAWYKGELTDKETNESHLAHAGCCIMMLMELEKFKNKNDKPKYYTNAD